MDKFYFFIGAALLLPVLWAAVTWYEAYSFKQRLYRLGHLVGRKKDEIILAIGTPNSFSTVGNGKELLQWQRPGYHIALLFTDGICDGSTHEYQAY